MNAARVARKVSRLIYFLFVLSISYFIFSSARSSASADVTPRVGDGEQESKRYFILDRAPSDTVQYARGHLYLIAQTWVEQGCVLGEFPFAFEREGKLYFSKVAAKAQSKLKEYSKINQDAATYEVYLDFSGVPLSYAPCREWLLVSNHRGKK